MGTHTVEDPEKVDTFKADGSGRISIGSEYSDEKVRVIIEETIN